MVINTLMNILRIYLYGKIGCNVIRDIFKLNRDYTPKNIEKVILPPELTNSNIKIDLNNIKEKQLKKLISESVNIMEKNFKKEDLHNFYNNINDLSTSNPFWIIWDNNELIEGYYDFKQNEIAVAKIFTNRSVVFHELLHMASCRCNNDIQFVGFSQNKIGEYSVGNALNEGYTELLTRRYIGKSTNVYDYSVNVVGVLEKIIGKEKMQSLYFNANLHGLVEELIQYSAQEEIMSFIASTDFVLNNIESLVPNLFKKNKINANLKYINKYLIKTYIRKQLREYKQNKITKEQMNNNIVDFIASFNIKPKNKKIRYAASSLSREEIISCFEEIFGKNNVMFNYEEIYNKDSNKGSKK